MCTSGSTFCARSRIWSTSRCSAASSMTCRMARRWRVIRKPRLLKACWRRPVVSAELMRSVVDARWVEEAMSFLVTERPGREIPRFARNDNFCGGHYGTAESRALPKPPARLRRRALQHLRVDREPPQNVMIHDDSEEHQKEDQADLDVALFESHAEIAAEAAFDGEKQNVAAIENGNRKQIED